METDGAPELEIDGRNEGCGEFDGGSLPSSSMNRIDGDGLFDEGDVVGSDQSFDEVIPNKLLEKRFSS